MERLHIHTLKALTVAAMLLVVTSCSIDWLDQESPDDGNRKVLLLYSAGFNSLTSYLKSDIEDLKKGWLPTDRKNDDVLLVYSHFPVSNGKYDTESSPVLVRLHRKSAKDSTAVADTLVIYEKGTISSSAEQLTEVLTYVRDNFQARSYGMIFSSHATGYLPAGYYQNPDNSSQSLEWSAQRRRALTAVPYVEPEHDPSMPMTKSIGQDQVGVSGSYLSYEMELKDFAEAIPMKLDYLLFDACLMGGIETAYELSGKTDLVGFSQTEVLAEGFDYRRLSTHLLKNTEPDPVAVCRDYFTQYDIQTGVYRSATISLVDCTRLEPLAEVCRGLFDIYGDTIRTMSSNGVQQYFRSKYHWFYDLESIIINAGATEEELSGLHEALDECMVYSAHTPEFMNSFNIHTYSGLSMYLPSRGSARLDQHYKTLKWNQATGLVE